MIIDCATCVARGEGCPDCVVTALLGPPRPPVDFDPAEHAALHNLARAGLVPPLRLVAAVSTETPRSA